MFVTTDQELEVAEGARRRAPAVAFLLEDGGRPPPGRGGPSQGRGESFPNMRARCRPFGHVARRFGHNTRASDLLVVWGFAFGSPKTMSKRCGETEMLKDAMKLERWVAVISVLLLLVLAELGWR